ncbi:MAG: DUF6856 family protein [Mycoplasmoidaceae bacterium]
MKKIIKRNRKKILLFCLFNISIITSFSLLSCSANKTSDDSIKLKIMELSTEANEKVLLSKLKEQNSYVKDAILGDTSINAGNYIFIYGSLAGSSSTLPFRSWLSGGGIENGGGVYIDPIVDSSFLEAFLSEKELNDKVKILLFIDNPTFKAEDNIFSQLNYDPFETYNEKILLDKYNYDYTLENDLPPSTEHNQIAEFTKLPFEYKALNGLYIRQDQSSIDYRNFVDYALLVRPNITSIVGDNNKLSGGLAFSNNKKPVLLGNVDNSNNTIASNETVKSLYDYYLDKKFESK